MWKLVLGSSTGSAVARRATRKWIWKPATPTGKRVAHSVWEEILNHEDCCSWKSCWLKKREKQFTKCIQFCVIRNFYVNWRGSLLFGNPVVLTFPIIILWLDHLVKPHQIQRWIIKIKINWKPLENTIRKKKKTGKIYRRGRKILLKNIMFPWIWII